jgi:murein DD-endopeptidase MepM/ murein hydrolase activator NlpD
LLVLLLVAIGWGAWGLLRVGAEPTVELVASREAIGPGTDLVASFAEPGHGLGEVRLELVQGDNVAVLGEQSFERGSPFDPRGGELTAEAQLEATVGRGQPEWLEEGEATVRAVATRFAGPMRSPDPVVVEQTLPVRFRPPALGLISTQHYFRQGGSGVVVFRAGQHAERSGVRAGEEEFPSYPLPDGGPNERFALFGIPWDLSDPAEVRIFAEDAAGNRAEMAFLDQLKPSPPRRSTIRLNDRFLEKVVPAIVSNTPELDPDTPLLEQYLRINREIRAKNRHKVRELSAESRPEFLWHGVFQQPPNTERTAGYADDRTYVYEGEPIDRQTHLGLDLASVQRAPVPAVADGIVLYAGYLGIYGNVVIVDHGYGLLSLYAHLSSISAQSGQPVAQGETVGRSGQTGLAGGDHLHLGVFIDGVAVDPIEWLDAAWIREKIASKVPLPEPEPEAQAG